MTDAVGIRTRERKGDSESAPERIKLLLAPVSSNARRGVGTPSTRTSNRIKFDERAGEMVETTCNEVAWNGSGRCCSTAATEDFSLPVERPASTGTKGFLTLLLLERGYVVGAALVPAHDTQKGSVPSPNNGDK